MFFSEYLFKVENTVNQKPRCIIISLKPVRLNGPPIRGVVFHFKKIFEGPLFFEVFPMKLFLLNIRGVSNGRSIAPEINSSRLKI